MGRFTCGKQPEEIDLSTGQSETPSLQGPNLARIPLEGFRQNPKPVYCICPRYELFRFIKDGIHGHLCENGW